MKAKVSLFEGNTCKSKQFEEVDELTSYFDKMFYGKYPIIRKAVLFLLDEMVRGREYCLFENDLFRVSYYLDTCYKDGLKFDFFVNIK